MSEAPGGLLREMLRLLKPFWLLAAITAVGGTASGLATAALLGVINRALKEGPGAFAGLLLGFLGLVALALIGKLVTDLANSALGERLVARLRRELAARIVAAPIDALERYRLARLIVALNQDIQILSGFAFHFSGLVIAFAVTVACFVYLFALSPLMFAVTLAGFAVGGVAQAWARKRGDAAYEASRDAYDDLQRHFGALTEGAKELRINRPRRARVVGPELGGTIDRLAALRIRAARIFQLAGTASTAAFFVVAALLLLWRDGAGMDGATVAGFMLVLLYVKGPVDQLIFALPLFGQARIAFGKLAELSRLFATPEPHLPTDAAATPAPEFRRFGLAGAVYRYPPRAGGEPGFALGPIDVEIGRGETVFVVGENGSGKTTLVKLLLGLYAPHDGALTLDGAPVPAEARDDFRQLFSAVFFDYHLFGDVIAPGAVDPAETARHFARLDIAHKVGLVDGRFTTTDLSAGQRKRLALIQVYLERRPVAVFDEWAAEQDPTFRRVFYTEILPEFRARGTTLIVVSHDDRYFDAADRILRLKDGCLVEDRRRAG
jgi:putative ATP-binding cassette transporter